MDTLTIEELIGKFSGREEYASSFHKKDVKTQDILLHEGETARYLYMVISGCLRQYCIREDGTEITFQFFIENQAVSSFESAFTHTPSRSYIEAIEDSTILYVEIADLQRIISTNDVIKDFFTEYLKQRLIAYINLHSSFVLDSPEKRYITLMDEKPELLERIPLQHIATYLGVTPVTLSRIRKRLKII